MPLVEVASSDETKGTDIMARATQTESNEVEASNGQSDTPALPTPSSVSTTGIPKRSAADGGGNFAHWAPVIEELRNALGTSYEYTELQKASSVAQGLRRDYGVKVATRKVDKKTGVGTIWVEYPSILADDGSRTEDTEAVTATKEKYSK